jgi:hypothetical protein
MPDLKDVLSHMQEKTPTFKISMLEDEKNSVWVRPLKTKDQKFAVIARDEGEDNELLNFENIINLLDELIVKNDIAVGNWTIQDFVWFLIQFRIKTMGELIEVNSKCVHCSKDNEYAVDLVKDAIVEKPGPVKGDIVTITESMKLLLGHINVDDMHEVLSKPRVERDMITLASIVKNVEFDEQLLDLTIDDKMKIIEELSKDQAEAVLKFPKENDFGITILKKWKCKECEKDNEMKFNGFEIVNFF